MSVKIINPHNISLHNVIVKGVGTLEIGKSCEIRALTVIEMGGNAKLGEGCVIGYSSFLQVTGNIEIGEYALLGPQCCFICSAHTIQKNTLVKTNRFIHGNINIGRNVWIGANCTINTNTTLGEGCVVGANSFVNKDIPAWEIWAGSPARYIKDVE